MTDRNTIGIGYYDPFAVYPLIQSEFEKLFPLQNLHVRFNPSQPLKTINNLPIQMIEEIPNKKSATMSQDADSIYSRVMFIKVESLDKYRSQVRPLIREWLKNLVFKYRNSWMIVLFIPLDAKDKQSTIIKMSHFDKLLKDFGQDGKELSTILPSNVTANDFENCLKLKQNEFEVNEVQASIKNLLSCSFNQRYHLFVELIKQRKVNSIERFVAYYSLTNLFDDMRLFHDALSNFEHLVTELSLVIEAHPELFDYSVGLPETFDGFNFEKFIDEPKVRANLFSGENVNLFELRCFVFLRQSYTLEKLADTSNSISIGALQISKLYRNLTLFLNDISKKNSTDLKEFEFSVIQYYLNIPIIGKLIEQAESSPDDNSYQLKNLLESRAELKLLQRSILIKLSQLNGLQIKGLEQAFDEISLEDEQEEKPKTSPTASTNPILVQAMKDKASYLDAFEKLTEDIIEDFLICERSKTIDVLSIDLAILNYEKGNYSECLQILKDSHEFFIQNGWNFLGGILLEIYYECVQKIEPQDNDEVLTTCLRILSVLVTNQIDINSFRLIKNKSLIEKLFQKVEEYSLLQNFKIESSLEDFFKTELVPYIDADESTTKDKYIMRLKIKNPFGIEFMFKTVELIMVDDEGSEIVLGASDVKVTPDPESTIQISTNRFLIGSFSPYRLSILMNEKLSLILDYGKKELQMTNASFVSDTVIEYNTSQDRIKQSTNDSVLAYQNLDKLNAHFNCANHVKLGTSEVVLKIVNGDNVATDINVKFFSTTEGLKLDKENETFEKLDKKERKDIVIPYTYFSENKIINMRAKIQYQVDGETYIFQISYNIDTTLTISVTVQDLFKQEFIYSKFQIGTSNSKFPIRLLDNELTTESDYKITRPTSQVHDIVTFGEQPATFFYKIIPNDRISSKDVLNLKVEYSNLQEECEDYVSLVVIAQLKDIGLSKYWFLVKDVIINKASFDLNNYAINNFIKFTNGLELNLLSEKIILHYVESSADQKKLFNLMNDLLVNNKLDVDAAKLVRTAHYLYISVAVPILKYLQVVEYEYDRKQYVVGEPINVQLKVKTITKWSDDDEDSIPLAASSPTRNGSASTQPHEEKFQLTIQHDDNWLMSGLKKFTFDMHQPEISSTDLILIPLNVGKIPLPRILIKSTTKDNDDLDIDFINGSETILVIPEVHSITFAF
ncbi:hypothetical protein Cantr_05921 [Candida viswanathii]|uniref:Trafficking protein particle complex II-specific subunit 130 n=1 Tax=Candida viswanathii TaxID=5486 RepID=A0A367XS21_9ASCO|nr:hypothetical protein Cantr_05921 [Candida viswanathii]